MLNFAICDDNLETLNQLSHMVESIFMENDLDANIALATTDGSKLLSYVDNNPVDVIFFDIILNSQITGLDIAERIRKKDKNCYFVFITEHSEFVFHAYKLKTFDYLCKPITKTCLSETILRLFNDANKDNKKYIKLNNKNSIIAGNEVQYIRRDGAQIVLHTDSQDYKIYSSLNEMENKLPNNFIRCHKSFIVNMENIVKIEPSSNLIYFKNNHTCDIGSKYKNSFMKGIHFYEKRRKY